MTLLDHYLTVFKKILHMSDSPTYFENYEQSRQTCVSLLEQAIHEADQLDISEEEKGAARVAVIAWLDETVLCSALPWRQRWQNELLQRKYLNITVAGEYFFTLLEQLEVHHKQAREVFLFCLQHGFHGQYSSPNDRSTLQAVIIEQRSLCLPDAWQRWPNDAAIVPYQIETKGTIRQRLRPLWTLIVVVTLLYATLYFFLNYYVS